MKIIIKFIFIIILSSFINYSYAKDPSEFISEVTDAASDILKENITKEEKAQKLILIAETAVDIDGIGLYSLGKYRKTISKEQLNKYKIIFREYFLKSFSSNCLNILTQE